MSTILVGYKHYPMTMARFFVAAMRRLGHEVDTCGPYSGDDGYIPWPGEPRLGKYIDKPHMVLPDMSHYPAIAVNPGKHYDVVFSFDAGFRLTGRHGSAKTVLYGTDPHALNYGPYLGEYDYYFSAQLYDLLNLGHEGFWIPLAYDPTAHRCDVPIGPERDVDVAFVGVAAHGAYTNRVLGLEALAAKYNLIRETGLIFDECTAVYNRAKIAYNWSSSWDIPMRIFEGMAYGCCVITNRLPYLDQLGFVDGEHYLGFDNLEELLTVTEEALKGKWLDIAKAGQVIGRPMTYDKRVDDMLDIVLERGGDGENHN